MMCVKKILPSLMLYLMLCLACDSSNNKQNMPHTTKLNYHEEKIDRQSFSAAVILDGKALTQTWQRFFGVSTDILTVRQQHALGKLKLHCTR